jgi:putative ABC transport system ATP-binding protein
MEALVKFPSIMFLIKVLSMRNRMRAQGIPEEAEDSGGDPSALIELRRVVKSFKNAAGEFTVLKGIDAAFYESQFVSIVGRSGSGKSTLLNMMTGIDHPTSGTVRIGKAFLHTMDEGAMSVWRGRQMGIVFQFFQLLPMLTLLENVMLPMDFCEMYDPAEREPRALDLLKMVGLEGLEYKYPAAVAGGQQQSAAVARALANNPPILVADEPTGNLDTRTAERVLEIFEEQVALGKTVLMVTHDNTLAMRAQRKLVISDGELVNECLSRAFPNLSHNSLLKLDHAAQAFSVAPGEEIYTGGKSPALLVVTQGTLDVVLAGRWGKPAAAGQVEAGMAFSRADAEALGRSLQSLRATAPVQALLFETLPDLADLKETLAASAQERAQEYAGSAKKKGA